MFESGAYVAEHVEPLRPSQIQPNGVDLTLDAVFVPTEPGRIERGGKTIGDRRELRPDASEFTLDPGGYIVRYGETVSIPADHIGFIYPRSSLLRNTCTLDTAVWDAGYTGKGEGLLEVYHPIEFERGARIAQIVLAQAAHVGTYEGDYQGEHVT